MDKAIDRDTVDADRVFLRRQFVKGIGGTVLAVGAGMLLTGCPSTSKSTNTNSPPPGGVPTSPLPGEPNTSTPPTVNPNPPP